MNEFKHNLRKLYLTLLDDDKKTLEAEAMAVT